MEGLEQYSQYGIGGVTAMIILKALEMFLKKNHDTESDCKKLSTAVDSLQTAITQQIQAIKDQTEAIKDLHIESKLNSQTLQRVTTDIYQIRAGCPVIKTKA